MNREKEPLYRKVNTTAHGIWHHKGSDASNDRNTKKGLSVKMKKGEKRGLDYTPLYRFLLSKVGQSWDIVHSEAVSRLDKEEALYHMVELGDFDRTSTDYFCNGESSMWSKLIIDEQGILQLKNSEFRNENLSPSCSCCTHTFNGKNLIKKYVVYP